MRTQTCAHYSSKVNDLGNNRIKFPHITTSVCGAAANQTKNWSLSQLRTQSVSCRMLKNVSSNWKYENQFRRRKNKKKKTTKKCKRHVTCVAIMGIIKINYYQLELQLTQIQPILPIEASSATRILSLTEFLCRHNEHVNFLLLTLPRSLALSLPLPLLVLRRNYWMIYWHYCMVAAKCVWARELQQVHSSANSIRLVPAVKSYNSI